MLLESDIAEILFDDSIIDTVTVEDDIKLKNDEIYKLWETNMHDFVPEDLTNFVIDENSAAVLYENIGHLSPMLIKGAYYVHGGASASPINVFVQDPDKNIIYKRSGEIQGIILFNTTIPGEYSFIFSNLDDNLEKVATLAIHTYEDKLDPIQYDINDKGDTVVKNDPRRKEREEDLKEELELAGDEEIANVRNLLRLMQTHSKQIQTEAKMSLLRQDSHNEDVLMNGDWHFYAMLVEVALFVAILAVQMNHLMVSLDNKLVL